MKMYDTRELAYAIYTGKITPDDIMAGLESAGVPKTFAIRAGLVKLKHEVKSAMQKGAKTVDIGVLNERLQHLAKIPRPGLPKQRCNGKCRCREPLK